ncbi:MAG: DUF4159 domain-containing protein [Nitrospinae bacterium]|nr:DUF4159 domain-containing protein [Nitrospinota bacterium]
MRKQFLIISLVIFLFGPVNLAAAGYSNLTLPRILYKGGNNDARPEALRSLLAQIARRTSIEVNREPIALKLSDPNLFKYPFIYLGGDEAFEPFAESDLKILRKYLSYGGFLFIDDNSAEADSAFDRSVRRMVTRLFPQTPLRNIPRDHSVFRSFYLLNTVSGRAIIKSYMEGISLKGRTVLMYSANDQAGAWSRNKLGDWNYDVMAGGYRQRQLSIRLGINIILYALTLDYKKDMVHLPIILERLRRYQSP